MANDGLPTNITLQVSGFLVSGTLVGGHEYFDNFASEFARPFGEGGERIKQAVSRNSPYEKVENPLGGYSGSKDYPGRQSAGYIHLKDAKFFDTARLPIPHNRGVWWRGRLSEVAGFVLSNLTGELKS